MKTNRAATHQDLEVRSIKIEGLEVRAAAAEGKPKTVVGYAAKFGIEAVIGGYMRETIRKGAFAEVLKTADVRCLVEHDEGKVIGRTKPGTLRLSEDSVGLRFECDLPDTQLARDLAVSIGRGDITGASIGFRVGRCDWAFARNADDLDAREITQMAELYDVSVVAFPAYEDTEVALRSAKVAKAERGIDPARAMLELRLRLASAA